MEFVPNLHSVIGFTRAFAGCAVASANREKLFRRQDDYDACRLFAGGGTDQTVRLIARHLERYIPVKPSLVVVNKPGAGGLIAVNELYNLRKPDGLTMSNINTGALFAVAGGNDAIKFQLDKFLYIGQALD